MERKLFYGIMTPGAVFTIVFGIWLIYFNPNYYLHSLWLQLKLVCVATLIIYHIYLGYLIQVFKHNKNQHSHVYYRWLNEFPTLMLFLVIILVIVKPF